MSQPDAWRFLSAVFAIGIMLLALSPTSARGQDGIYPFLPASSPAGSATPAPTTGIASLDAAMAEQEAGDGEAALASYTNAINLLNEIVSRPLEPQVAKLARDRLAFAVIQTAVLERGRSAAEEPLRYAFGIEQKYLTYEVRVASRRFSEGRFSDGFAIYRVFATRAGDDRKTGRAKQIYDALSAASNGDLDRARSILANTIRYERYRFGNSFPLYLLGEVYRAMHRGSDAQKAFWRALDERESGALQFGLYGPQILAAAAISDGW